MIGVVIPALSRDAFVGFRKVGWDGAENQHEQEKKLPRSSFGTFRPVHTSKASQKESSRWWRSQRLPSTRYSPLSR